MRRGQGIEITRHDGRRFVVTVDDATVGAGVTKLLVNRVHAAS
jgi:ferric-dicitrate binding protein FerR (iron transport regulator)